MQNLVTVFGGTGFVGTQAVRYLAKSGWRIRVAVRNPNLAYKMRLLGDVGQIDVVQANIRDMPSLERALDGATASLNLVGVMRLPHPRFYDRAFGADPAQWRAASPLETLMPGAAPMLVVCSTQRADASCLQSQRFVAHAAESGVRASVLEEDLSHGEINAKLGLPGAYTDAVERFLESVGIDLR